MTQGTQRSSQKTSKDASKDASDKQKHSQPRRSDMVLHAVKTTRLVGAVMADKRVPAVRKVGYVGIIGAMLAVLLFPEVFADVVVAITPFLPLDLLGIPAEGVFDWVAFAVASFSLLKLFPAEIVGEHYDRLFRR